MLVKKDLFGLLPPSLARDNWQEPRPVYVFTLLNKNGTIVRVMNYGATIISLCVRDGKGAIRDVVLGFDTLEEYVGIHGENPYIGATIGRVANSIRNGQFVLDNQSYQLSVNDGPHHLHGGVIGFDKKFWECSSISEEACSVSFEYLSPDGEEGYPGDLRSRVTFELTEANEIKINYSATTTKSTPICLTNHSYFNLGGHAEARNGKLKNHLLQVNAEKYTPVDENLIPTGSQESVENSIYDFRSPQNLSKLLESFPKGQNGYDINFCLNKTQKELETDNLNFVACVRNTESGIGLQVFSTLPGVQLYTANFFPDTNEGQRAIKGKAGSEYGRHGALCLETQNYPNAVNIDELHNTSILVPGETYKETTVFKFFTSES